jgi:hypothetical protein
LAFRPISAAPHLPLLFLPSGPALLAPLRCPHARFLSLSASWAPPYQPLLPALLHQPADTSTPPVSPVPSNRPPTRSVCTPRTPHPCHTARSQPSHLGHLNPSKAHSLSTSLICTPVEPRPHPRAMRTPGRNRRRSPSFRARSSTDIEAPPCSPPR